MYIYIYIYRERERQREKTIYIYIYICAVALGDRDGVGVDPREGHGLPDDLSGSWNIPGRLYGFQLWHHPKFVDGFRPGFVGFRRRRKCCLMVSILGCVMVSVLPQHHPCLIVGNYNK